MIHIKSQREIDIMRESGIITATILADVVAKAGIGVTTKELDELAEKLCNKYKVTPAFKGYHGFPACICISVNEQVVHGIPSKKKILMDGDIVGLDFGVIHKGYFGDTAVTIPIGKISKEAQKLIDITRESLYKGIEQAILEGKLFDISYAVQSHAEAAGYSIVREFVGHGIGKSLHEDPQIPNFGPKGKGIALKEGMVLAIEPMVNSGKAEIRVLSDGWTAVTVDGMVSAHFEHTIALTSNGPEILTIPG